MKYEAHITFKREQADRVKELALTSRWSYSAIYGDPLLGQEPWCYLTASGSGYETLKAAMVLTAEKCRSHGAYPVRMKIEEVLYDWLDR